ncbi:DUF6124 family protein [Pseudomonas sp. MCal1]|uniref:DUF6124 family protein n=1 Tax=Pseudomonas sp. MCal1 TaxID=2919887 RepID=UPI0022562EA1|nr:DUF6124 family protein [Pseudomonas sp. MCal1]MCX4221282.1 DUF6124 family protein [Pseudomonas sp. MCal1]
MKIKNTDSPHAQDSTSRETLDSLKPPTTTFTPIRDHSRNREPVSHIFTILPEVDTESLLCHASENLASLNIMATNLAGEVEGPQRNVTLAIQQLTVLSELLVNRALDNLDPP